MADQKSSENGPSELGPVLDQLSLSTDNEVPPNKASSDPYKPLRFMDFPSEIRNAIYHKTLTYPDENLFIGNKYCPELCRGRAVLGYSLSPFMPLSDYPEKEPASTRNLAILRTSKTVHGEAGTILYGQSLIFVEMVALQSFLTGLRPQQFGLLRHVAVADDVFNINSAQVDLMPSVFGLLGGAANLETLRIPGITTIRAPFRMSADGLHDTADETITVACWDAAVGRNLASEIYSRLFTYLRVAVAARGIDEVMGILGVFSRVFRRGHDEVRMRFRPAQVVGFPWTEERKVALRKAMGEEILRLLEADNN